MTTYKVTLPDGRVKTRKTARTYTHAVACKDGDRGPWYIAGFCGSRMLAEKLERTYRGWGIGQTQILDAETVMIPTGQCASSIPGPRCGGLVYNGDRLCVVHRAMVTARRNGS